MAFTFFYRDSHVLDLLAHYFIPGVSGYKIIKVWDAGCAMGPEPYTLAMILADKMGKFAFRNLRIDATDIDESQHFGETIEAGFYAEEMLRRIPRESLESYFEASEIPGMMRIVPLIRERVRFRRHDLLSLDPPGSSYHAVVCKNVLLHFSPEQRIDVLRMFHRALLPSGLLCMEHTQKLPAELIPLFRQLSGEAQIFESLGQ
jgi:chemotaxis protein methyltransferase CheR